ncbi:MAG: STAS domain-containing protein [Pseudomonadota bacterium]
MTDQPNQSPLEVEISSESGYRMATIAGRVDHTNATLFLGELEKVTGNLADGEGIVLDFGGLEFITSAGLRGLVIAQKRLGSSGSKLAITGLKGTVADVFRISRFDTLFPVAETPEAASALVTG